MLNTRSTPKPNEGAFLWLIKILAGVLIVVLLGLHLVVNHFLGPKDGLLDYAAVLLYYKNPLIPIVEIAFLIAAVSHSLIGTRSMILDLNPSRQVLAIIDKVFIAVGVLAVGYGTWLALVVALK